MLKYGRPCQTKTRNPSSSPCLLQDVVSQNTDLSYRAHGSHSNWPFVSYTLPQQQRFSQDSTGPFTSPPGPLSLQRPTELSVSAPIIPESWQQCSSCRSVLQKDVLKTGRPAWTASSHYALVSKPHSPTSPHLAGSPPSHHSSSPSPTSNAWMDFLTPPPSEAQPLWSSCEGRDLNLLNQHLHHIISHRASSPNLSAYHTVTKQEFGGRVSTVLDNRDRSHSMSVPLFFSPSQDRSSLSLCDTEPRPRPLVG